MGNTGTIKLGLRNVYGEEVSASNSTLKIKGLNRPEITIRDVRLPGTFGNIPAFPQVHRMICRVYASRYRSTRTCNFPLLDGGVYTEMLNVWMHRNEWSPDFDRWNDLPALFSSMKRVLGNSGSLKIKNGMNLGLFTENRYENPDARIVKPKAGLLNITAKMSKVTDPTTGGKRWFTYLNKMLEIAPDRIIAEVDPEMAASVQKIRQNISNYDGYKRARADLHYKNFPRDKYEFKRSDMFSVKSTDALGNLQLTLVPAIDSAGNEVVLLDADIDEHGKLLGHILDLFFRHPFRGGTHPFDVHQILAWQNEGTPFGYRLV